MAIEPKGYYTYGGYMGWIGDRYMLFATEDEYKEFLEYGLDIHERLFAN